MHFNTNSISKGCFAFKNASARKDPTQRKTPKKEVGELFQKNRFQRYLRAINEQPFFRVYQDTWKHLKVHIERLQNEFQSQLLEDIVRHTINGREASQHSDLLPGIVVLTGINQPDHLEQFELLGKNIQKKTTANVCLLPARDCSSVKAGIENLVYNFTRKSIRKHTSKDTKNSSYTNGDSMTGKTLKRSQCTMRQLKIWYEENWPMSSTENSHDQHLLVVILPDFECFPSGVLQDFLQILSRHCHEIPFVLIIGVATSISTLYETLPHHVTCHLQLRIYKAKLAPERLNEILDDVLLSPKYPFWLSGRVLKFLTYIFLHYDFSINGFIQSYKYCLMEHFFQGNIYALCSTNYTQMMNQFLDNMCDEDFEDIRQQLSFRSYIESIDDDPEEVIALLTDNNALREKLPELIKNCHEYFMVFRVFMEFLYVLVKDVPKGLQIKCRRELYILLSMRDDFISRPEFKECWHILGFMSHETLYERIKMALSAARHLAEQEMYTDEELSESCKLFLAQKFSSIEVLLEKMKQSKDSPTLIDPMAMNCEESEKSPPQPETNIRDKLSGISSRAELKNKLLEMNKTHKSNAINSVSGSKPSIDKLLNYIRDDIIAIHLRCFGQAPPLHELFVFSNIGILRRNTIGAPRAALHLALNDPQHYLQCKCCTLESPDQIKDTLPDIGIMYKLHLECGRLINIFDWLQAFNSIVEVESDEKTDEQNINSLIQARFTYAMSELQFLGYIKMSKAKTDHATRLTW